MRDAQQFGQFFHTLAAFASRHLSDHQGEVEMILDGHRRKKRSILRHVTDTSYGGVQAGDIHAGQADCPRADAPQTNDRFEERRFS